MKKLCLILLCTMLLLFTVACHKQPEEPAETALDSYEEITDAYRELLLSKQQDVALIVPGSTEDALRRTLCETVETCNTPAEMGYAIKDINGDGVEELVLMQRNGKLYLLFTKVNGKPVLLADLAGKGAIDAEGTVYCYSSSPEGMVMQVRSISGARLEGLTFGWDPAEDGSWQYYQKNELGERVTITKSEFQALEQQYSSITMGKMNAVTKEAALRFIPSLEQTPSEAPVLRLSDYEDVLELYRTVVSVFGECNNDKWNDGVYDTLYQFPDNQTYEVFHALFSGGFQARPTTPWYGITFSKDGTNAYGYARKDLDSNGVEELILLTDRYELIAVFTLREGVPTLQYHPSKERTAYLDDQGRIHEERNMGGMTGRDSEFSLLTWQEGQLTCSFTIGARVNLYLQNEGWYRLENGERVSMTKTEFEALYAEYDLAGQLKLAEGEYTRMAGKLSFLHLNERIAPAPVCYLRNPMGGDELEITALTDGGVRFRLYYLVEEYENNLPVVVYERELTGEATLENGVYTFRVDGFAGSIELGVDCAWLLISESPDAQLTRRPYLFSYVAD